MDEQKFGELILAREMYFAYHGGILSFDGGSKIQGPLFICFSTLSSLGVGCFFWPPLPDYEAVRVMYLRRAGLPVDQDDFDLLVLCAGSAAGDRGRLCRVKAGFETVALPAGPLWYHSPSETLDEYRDNPRVVSLLTGSLVARPQFVVGFPPLPYLFASPAPGIDFRLTALTLLDGFVRWLHIANSVDGAGRSLRWLISEHKPSLFVVNTTTGSGTRITITSDSESSQEDVSYGRLWERPTREVQQSLF